MKHTRVMVPTSCSLDHMPTADIMLIVTPTTLRVVAWSCSRGGGVLKAEEPDHDAAAKSPIGAASVATRTQRSTTQVRESRAGGCGAGEAYAMYSDSGRGFASHEGGRKEEERGWWLVWLLQMLIMATVMAMMPGVAPSPGPAAAGGRGMGHHRGRLPARE